MIEAAMLATMRDCGEGVLVLTEGLGEHELLRSRLTRHEVQRQLGLMAGTVGALSAEARAALPEIDWAGWAATGTALGLTGPSCDEALWFAVESLVPATLLWLRVYRNARPELFAFRP